LGDHGRLTGDDRAACHHPPNALDAAGAGRGDTARLDCALDDASAHLGCGAHLLHFCAGRSLRDLYGTAAD
jgi:hypothetical protein